MRLAHDPSIVDAQPRIRTSQRACGPGARRLIHSNVESARGRSTRANDEREGERGGQRAHARFMRARTRERYTRRPQPIGGTRAARLADVTVLVATDLSQSSRRTDDVAAEIARSRGDELVVLHCAGG